MPTNLSINLSKPPFIPPDQPDATYTHSRTRQKNLRITLIQDDAHRRATEQRNSFPRAVPSSICLFVLPKVESADCGGFNPSRGWLPEKWWALHLWREGVLPIQSKPSSSMEIDGNTCIKFTRNDNELGLGGRGLVVKDAFTGFYKLELGAHRPNSDIMLTTGLRGIMQLGI